MNKKQSKEEQLAKRNRNLRVFAILLILIIIWLGFTTQNGRGRITELGDLVKSLQQKLEQTQKSLSDKNNKYASLQKEYEEKKAEWAIEKDNYEKQKKQKDNQIKKLKAARDRIDRLLRDGTTDGTIIGLLAERDTLNAQLDQAYLEKEELTNKISALEKNLENSKNTTNTLLEIFAILRETGDINTTPFDHEEVIELGSYVLDSISRNSNQDLKNLDRAIGKLVTIQERFEKSEILPDSLNISEIQPSNIDTTLLSEIQKTLDDLRKRKEQVSNAKELLDKRFVLIASASDLARKEVLVHKNGKQINPDKLPKQKYLKFEARNININDCLAVDRNSGEIKIPTNKINIVDIHTNHGGNHAYELSSNTPEPSLTSLKIFDTEEFWKESIFLVVEIR